MHLKEEGNVASINVLLACKVLKEPFAGKKDTSILEDERSINWTYFIKFL